MPDRHAVEAAEALIAATMAVAEAGVPLMLRVLPPGTDIAVWDHYPPDDAVDAASGSRWFYHAHPPGERDAGEHGHFHLFFDRAAFGDATLIAGPAGGASSGADVVHIVAIAIDLAGLPSRLFTVNRWVTDEWLHDAAAIVARLHGFDLANVGGDPLVNAWLTAAVALFRTEIAAALARRDAAIANWTPDAFEDRSREILSTIAIDLDSKVGAILG